MARKTLAAEQKPAVYITGTYVEVRSASAGGRVLARLPYRDGASRKAALHTAHEIVFAEEDRRRNARRRELRAKKSHTLGCGCGGR